MAAVWSVVRSDLRHRWRSLVVLALVVGIVVAIVFVALAGARRTTSAFPRFREATLESDASVEVSPEYFDDIAALPHVKAVAPASFMFVLLDGLEDDDLVTITGTDQRFGTVVNRLLLEEGRSPSPERADEVLINREVADRLRLGLGDSVSLASLTPEQLEELIGDGDTGRPAGPRIDVTVVGIGQFLDGLARGTPLVEMTPAFYAAHRDEVGHFDDILHVRLTAGDRDIAAFRAGVQRVVPESKGAIVETQAETAAEIKDATGVQAASLYVFAIVAALAGFVALGQALARQTAWSSAEQPALRALGLSRRQRFAALLTPGVLVAGSGAALAVVLALLASPILPTGFARRVEPTPGFAADWLVVGVGFAAAAVLISARAAVSAGIAADQPMNAPRRATGVARFLDRLARLGAPPPVLSGVSMALVPGRGQTAITVRPAVAGAVVGVTGIVAALTFGAALHWLVTEPAAYGWTWDASVVGPRAPDDLKRAASKLAENDDVRGVAALSVQPIRLGGVPVGSYGLDPLEGEGFTTVLEGRAPSSADEVLVGTDTLDRLGREIGASIIAAGLEGRKPRKLTIVGRGVFPEFIHPAVPDSDSGAYNDFALLTRAGSEPFAADAGGEYFSEVLVRFAPGVDTAAARASLKQHNAARGPTNVPDNVRNLEQVDQFPLILGGFLVLLAAFAIAHVLVTSVRRRARDLAVLQTLGFVGSQVRGTIAWQASALGAIGLVLGIPAGIILGRLIWSVVANSLGVDTTFDVPWLAIVSTIPAAFLLVNLLALFPSRAAARTRPAAVLRSE